MNRWFWKHGDLSYGYEVQGLVCIAVVLMVLPFIGLILELAVNVMGAPGDLAAGCFASKQ